MLDVNGGGFVTREHFWLVWGFASQALFAARFVVQWIASEIRRVSYIPKSFWYLSMYGSIGLLVYSIYRNDPVFILGQGLSLVIYIRNIMLIRDSATGLQD